MLQQTSISKKLKSIFFHQFCASESIPLNEDHSKSSRTEEFSQELLKKSIITSREIK